MKARKKYRISDKTKRARSLRNDATGAEKMLWTKLNRKQVNGLKFRRQHPMGVYVLDFYCVELKLCIEVDGGQHNDDIEIQRDRRRTEFLERQGVYVVRFWNIDVFDNLEGVLDSIWEVAETLRGQDKHEEDWHDAEDKNHA